MARPTKTDKSITLSTWTVRDVPNEARNAARIYAKKENKPLGIWIGNAILSACNKEQSKPKELTRTNDNTMEAIKEMHARIEKMSELLNKPWWEKIMGK